MNSRPSFSYQLIPGVPNEITLNHIATKLQWTTLYSLSAVSKHWRQAIRSRQVYNARIRANTREELATIKHDDEVGTSDAITRNAISLYSMREKRFYKLPTIPFRPSGFSQFCQIMASKGKLYVWLHNCLTDSCLNAYLCSETAYLCSETELLKVRAYMIDLAGLGQWQECLRTPGAGFLLPGFDQTIDEYSFHINCRHHFKEPHNYFQANLHPDYFNPGVEEFMIKTLPSEVSIRMSRIDFEQESLSRGLWRGDSRRAQQNKYGLKTGLPGVSHIYVQDNTTKLWRHKHDIALEDDTLAFDEDEITYRDALFDFGVRGEKGPHLRVVRPVDIIPVNNEVLSIASWHSPRGSSPDDVADYEILQSKGLGTESTEIVWEIIPHPFTLRRGVLDPYPYARGTFWGLCTILL